jgi:phosphoribosylamine--glycine ligase
MASLGMPFIGVLCAGLMLTENGLKVLDFYCRFGDPETQVVLPLLKTDLVDVILACTSGQLKQVPLEFYEGACTAVVLASPGYPAAFPTGLSISGVDEATALHNVTIFQSGTILIDGQLKTNGGRVLSVSALAPDLETALKYAYEGVEKIHFEGVHYRKDIGQVR